MTWHYFQSQLQLLLEQYSKREDGSIDLVKRSNVLREIKELFDEKKIDKLKNKLNKLQKNTGVDTSVIFEYLDLLQTETTKEDGAQQIEIPPHILQAVIQRCDSTHQVVKLPLPYSYEMSKELSRLVFESDAKEQKLAFFITKEKKWKGRVTTALYPNETKQVPLIEAFQNKQDNTVWLRFFGERATKAKPYDELYHGFFFYRFKVKNKTYLLISEKPVNTGYCSVVGMKITQPDNAKVGEDLKIQINQDFIFAYDVFPEDAKISKEEVIEKTKDWNEEKLAWLVFGKHRHPKWFEWLIYAWLFSGKFDGYPLHLGIMGPAGTGKTRGILMPLTFQIPEPEPKYFFDGTKSTIKGLVPNFGGREFDEGYFASCRRIALVDEFLTALKRAYIQGGIQNAQETAMLTTLLEHFPTPASSGKTKPVKVTSSAKLLLTTNPKHGLNDLVSCASSLDNPFMSRILWYNQNRHHINFVQDRQIEIGSMPEDKKYAKREHCFVQVFDFLNSFTFKIDTKWVEKKIKEYKAMIPAGLMEVYSARYSHHLMCLVDGIAKTRWLVSKDKSVGFEVLEEDYVVAEEIFSIVLMSWGLNVDLNMLPLRTRELYLNIPQQRVYDYISKGGIMSLTELNEIFKEDVSLIVSQLSDLELLKKVDNKWFPHWHEATKKDLEVDINDGEGRN